MPIKLENLALKTIAKKMPEAVVLADEKGRITWMNPAFERLCGYSPTEILGESPGDFLQGKDTDRKTVRELRVAVKEGHEIRTDILNYHKDGHSYWARVSITPLRNTTGSLQGFIAIERDVTAEHENLKILHGEVVELYTTILLAEQSNGLELEPRDPFCGRASRLNT
jgi:PAS domain S-box-containing protein